MRALLPATVPRLSAIRLDLTAVGFAAGVSMVVGLAFGTAPAWMSTALASFDVLRDGGRTATGGRQWLRRGLVVGQVALAALLLAAAGAMATSLFKLQRVDVGFRADGVVTQQLVLPQSRYDGAAQTRFYQSPHRLAACRPAGGRRRRRLSLAVRQQPGLGDDPPRSAGAGRCRGSGSTPCGSGRSRRCFFEAMGIALLGRP